MQSWKKLHYKKGKHNRKRKWYRMVRRSQANKRNAHPTEAGMRYRNRRRNATSAEREFASKKRKTRFQKSNQYQNIDDIDKAGSLDLFEEPWKLATSIIGNDNH